MRTTLELPDALFREAKNRAVQQGVTIKELLAKYIEAGLRASHIPENNVSPRKNTRPLPVAIARIPGTPLHTPLSNRELDAILEQEDLANYQRVISQTSNAG